MLSAIAGTIRGLMPPLASVRFDFVRLGRFHFGANVLHRLDHFIDLVLE